MQPYVSRMINERNELSDRIGKLGGFIYDNPAFESLSEAKQALMRQQLVQMGVLNKTLTARIALEDVLD